MTHSLPVIFLAFANSPLAPLAELTEEAEVLRRTLEQSHAQRVCSIQVREHASLQQVVDVFSDPRFTAPAGQRVSVFHFAGHANDYQLHLEAPATGGWHAQIDGIAASTPSPAFGSVHASSFSEYLGRREGLHLVFLNGCATRAQAQALLRAGVKVVIVTNQRVLDRVARDFAIHFYRELATGSTIKKSFFDASALVSSTSKTGNPRDFLIPDIQRTMADDIVPWELHVSDRFSDAADWDLAQAAGDPLFGLPSLPAMPLPLGSPYRHLSWYEEEHAPVFFGRGWDIRKLYGLVTNPHGTPIVFVFGQTGVGKSSLLAAGLLPRLKATRCQTTGAYTNVIYCRRDSDLGLSATLCANFIQEVGGSARDAWVKLEETAPLVLILDQVEEVFTRRREEGPIAELQALMNLIIELFGDYDSCIKGKLILSFRKEWYAELDDVSNHNGVRRSNFHVKALDKNRIVDVIRGPIDDERLSEHYQLTIDPDVVEAIASDVSRDSSAPIAPTLQVLLNSLWTAAKSTNPVAPHFSPSLYESFRHRLGLDVFLDDQLESMKTSHMAAVTNGLILDILESHTTLLGTSEQRSLSSLQSMYPAHAHEMADFIQAMKSRYVLADPPSMTVDQPSTSRLTHDTLAPIIRNRFTRSVMLGQRARRILESRSLEPTDSLDDHDLAVVERGLPWMRKLQESEEQLLRNSKLARRKRDRLERTIATIIIALIVVVACFASYTNSINRSSRSQGLASQALAIGETGYQFCHALQLALTAVGVDDNLTSRSTLYTIMRRNPGISSCLRGHTGIVSQVLFSPDGIELATSSVSDSILLWNMNTLEQTRLSGNSSGFMAIAYKPDGSTIASANTSGQIALHHRPWSDFNVTYVLQPAMGSTLVTRLTFSPDGSLLAGAFDNGRVGVWSVSSGQQVRSLMVEDLEHISDVEFSPNGALLVASAGKVIKAWSTKSWIETVEIKSDKVDDMVFTPDGASLISIEAYDENSWIRFWDINSGKRLSDIGVPNGSGGSLVISGDGNRLAVGSLNRTITVWKITRDGAKFAVEPTTLHGHPQGVTSISISRKDNILASGDESGLILLWDVLNTPPVGQTFALREGQSETTLTGGTFDSGGQRLLSGTASGSTRVWDMSSRTLIAELSSGISSPVVDVTYDSVSDAVLAAHENGTITAWEVSSNAVLWQTESRLPKPTIIRSAASWNNEHVVTIGGLGEAVEAWSLKNDRRDSKLIASPLAHVSTLAINSAGVMALASNDGEIAFFSLKHHHSLGPVITTDSSGINDLAFHPSSPILAAVHSNGSVWMIDTDVFQILDSEIRYVEDSCSSIAFSSLGDIIALGCSDGTVQLWDVASRSLKIQVKSSHVGPVNDLVMSPSDDTLASLGADGEIVLWDLTVMNDSLWHAEACRIAGVGLDTDDDISLLELPGAAMPCANTTSVK